ncbi:tetratricopeptide repeat protein [Jiulongibacter sp. NS-SX5]|uniref:tetratricopeptide repeat protein n=1 Tax=Jiulongibacter sp. NS-SX5 TaxID=3463854 RepID=UPI004059B2C9
MKALRFCSFCCLIFYSFIATAQYNSRADSLLAVYEQAEEDTNKIRVINHLINAFMYADPIKTKEFIDEGLWLSQRLKYEKGLNLFHYQNGNYYYTYEHLDSAEMAYQKAYDIAVKLKNLNSQARAKSGLAVSNLEKGNLNKAEQLFTECLELMVQTGDSLSIGVTYNHLANISEKRGHYKIAIEYLTRSLNVLFTQSERFRVADAYFALADVEMALEHFKEAKDHYQLAYTIYQEENDEPYMAYASVGLGGVHSEMKMYDAAENKLRQALDYALQTQNESLELTALKELNDHFIRTRQFSEVLASQERIEELTTGRDEKLFKASIQNQLSEAYMAKGNPNLVLELTDSTIHYSQASENTKLLSDAYLLRSKAFKQLGKPVQALQSFEMHKNISDSLLNQRKSQQIEELRIQFDTETKEREIETLNLEVEKSNLRKTLFGVGMISALVIAGLIYFSLRQRNKRNMAEYEKEKALIAHELAYKKKELVSQTLHLVNKNTLIQELKENLKEIKKTTEVGTKEIGKIIKDLQQENASDANWEVFKSHFAQVHNDFDIKLKQKAPDITDNEIRLAAFLKMKLSTKEIAGMLNVQPDSITKSKYRLKKKFNLEADVDFNAFLESV